jgi:hypothetical protein
MRAIKLQRVRAGVFARRPAVLEVHLPHALLQNAVMKLSPQMALLAIASTIV